MLQQGSLVRAVRKWWLERYCRGNHERPLGDKFGDTSFLKFANSQSQEFSASGKEAPVGIG